jgi:hypothetical protein
MTREQMIDEAVRRVYRPGGFVPVPKKLMRSWWYMPHEEFVAQVIAPAVRIEFHHLCALKQQGWGV